MEPKSISNYLTFYSGEFGQEYKNRNRVKAEGTYTLSFETARHYQNGTSKTDSPWSLLMSTDYNGSGEVADVQAATWTDISDRFTFSTARTFAKTHSGTVNITGTVTIPADATVTSVVVNVNGTVVYNTDQGFIGIRFGKLPAESSAVIHDYMKQFHEQAEDSDSELQKAG